MSRKFLEKTLDFITNSNVDERRIIPIDTIGKYKLFIMKNDSTPCYYIEYESEDGWSDVYYKFCIGHYDFMGMGELADYKLIIDYFNIDSNWKKVLNTWNENNPNKIIDINTCYIEYEVR